jgi:hypothetical protein
VFPRQQISFVQSLTTSPLYVFTTFKIVNSCVILCINNRDRAPCVEDLKKFYQAVRKDVTTFNQNLAKKCKTELHDGVCAIVATGSKSEAGESLLTPFACLKKHKSALSAACSGEVFKEEVEEEGDALEDEGRSHMCMLFIDIFTFHLACSSTRDTYLIWKTHSHHFFFYTYVNK